MLDRRRMPRLSAAPSWLRDTLLRLLPHATRPGLRAIGRPNARSRVLVTGNFTLTVRRLERVLEGRDVWLLVCNSRGINVWCAAGGGHFTHHDVIGAVRASRLSERVEHRELVLPQLGATGIEPGKIEEATGFSGRWGPARLEDLPPFLDRGAKVTRAHRTMRFPLWERLEMSLMWAGPMVPVAGLVGWMAGGLRLGLLAAGLVLAQVLGIFALLPHLPLVGASRWLTYGGAALLGSLAGFAGAGLLGDAAWPHQLGLSVVSVSAMAILSLDLAGTTPWHPGTINTLGNRFDLELVEDRCTGAASCVQVCPREVLHMNGRRHKVEIRRPEDCLRCGACIVQCPDDALRFRFTDGRIVEAQAVRRTRTNMLGRRSIEVGAS